MFPPKSPTEQTFRFLASSSTYELQDLLGVGGMGRTYLALRKGPEGFSKLVAIKRLLPPFTSDPSFVQSLIEEAKLAALFNHPNLVSVEELGFDKGEFFLVMEYVPGVTLTQLLQQEEKLPFELLLFVISEVLQALAYAHRFSDAQGRPLGIIHRDISPENILISNQGHIKLTDFGLAKNHRSRLLTEPGTIKGKRFYMSPEQAGGEPLDPRSDLFSVAVVMLEGLLGFRFSFNLPQGHLWSLFDEGSLPLRAWLKELPPSLEEILRVALQKQPHARFASALHFLHAIQPFLLPFSTEELRTALASWCPFENSSPQRLRLSPLLPSKPTVFILSQDGVFTPEQRHRLSDPFQGTEAYRLVFLDTPEAIQDALLTLKRKSFLPLAVVFGGLSVALHHPLLLELQNTPSVLRILLLRQPQDEILGLTVALCGLHAWFLSPCDFRQILPFLRSSENKPPASLESPQRLREQIDEQKTQILHLKKQNEALSQANLRAATLVQDLEETRSSLEAKTLFLERLARTLGPSSLSRPELHSNPAARIFLQGELAQLPLLDLFRLLSMSKKTAAVSFQRGNSEGSVTFQKGELVDASVLGLRGMAALFEFSSWEEGQFSVHEITRKIQITISLPVEQVLLEIARHKAEAERSKNLF